MKKRTQRVARTVKLILEPSDTMLAYDKTKPDPRLRELVRILA